MAKTPKEGVGGNQTDGDQFPTIAEGLRRIAASPADPDVKVRRVDIRFDARGNAVYRYWVGREKDWDAGHHMISE